MLGSEVKMYLTLIKIIAPVVLIAGYTWVVHSHGVDTERKRWETKAYQATIQSHEAASKFTAGVLSDHKETETDAQTKIDRLQDNVAVANTAADIVRDELEAFVQRSADDSARFANDRKAAEARYRVLADMYKESDRLAGIYAKEADQSRIAGLACEKAYSDLARACR